MCCRAIISWIWSVICLSLPVVCLCRSQVVWWWLQWSGVRLPWPAEPLQRQGQRAESCWVLVSSAWMERVAWPHSRAVWRTSAVCSWDWQLCRGCEAVLVYSWPVGHWQLPVLMCHFMLWFRVVLLHCSTARCYAHLWYYRCVFLCVVISRNQRWIPVYRHYVMTLCGSVHWRCYRLYIRPFISLADH